LLREELFSTQYKYGQVRYKRLFALYAVWIAVLIIVTLPWLWDFKTAYGQKALNNDLTSYQEIYAVLQKKGSLNSRIYQDQQFLNSIQAKSKQPRSILDKTRKILPSDVALKNLSQLSDGSVRVSVSIIGPENLSKAWTALSKTGMFKETDLNNVVVSESEKKDLILTLTLKQ
jgi:hypothetical protein